MKKNITRINLFVVMVFLTAVHLSGQGKSVRYDLYDMLESNKLELFNRQLSPLAENGIRGIRFSKNENDGIAWLKGIEFSNGIIELDIRGKDIFQQSFVGIAFHGIDNVNLDAVYFRPFNFQSPDPARKIHAVQYISQPDNTWYVLREKHTGEYEKAVSPAPNGNDWFHAKIEINYPKVTVYINSNTEPSLIVDQLNNRQTGKVGLWVGNNSDGDFANLQISTQD